MKNKLYIIFIIMILFTGLASAYEVISISLSRDWHFNEKGIFTVNSLRFFVFDINEDLIYECELSDGNNWQMNSGYVDVLYDIAGNNTEFKFHDGRYGFIHYNIYQPIPSLYIEEIKKSIQNNEQYSIKVTYSLLDCISVQGHVYGNKINLNNENNWGNIFGDGSGAIIVGNDLQLFMPNDTPNPGWENFPIGSPHDGGSGNGGYGGGNCDISPCAKIHILM